MSVIKGKVLDMTEMDLEQLRKEFEYLSEVCSCSRLSLTGKCTPKKCFPRLIKLLYLDGYKIKWKIIRCSDGVNRKFPI